MHSPLASSISLFAFAVAPALLVIRFFWPRIMPRWAVLVTAAALGGTVFYVSELLYRADMLQQFGGFSFPRPDDIKGMVVLQGPQRIDFILGAVLQLAYLLLWLVPYGITKIVLDRRRQSAHVVAQANA